MRPSIQFAWLNEPPSWREADGVLQVATGDRTDFWRETHYGFIRDDGHLAYREVSGDFTASVEFSGEYEALYDQAGLMLRLDEWNWIKAGIELVGGREMLSAVVTRDYSDWSTIPLPEKQEWIALRFLRSVDAVRIEWGAPGGAFHLFRLAHFPPGDPVMVGPMCCSPQRAGFRAAFRGFTLGPLVADPLHGA